LEFWSFEIVSKLSKEYRTEEPILVHCAAGMQRSAAVMAMFLIAKENMSAEDAIKFIREKRPIAFMPMANFGSAIKGFERSLGQILE
jgi:protein-tyrosine phosphatase